MCPVQLIPDHTTFPLPYSPATTNGVPSTVNTGLAQSLKGPFGTETPQACPSQERGENFETLVFLPTVSSSILNLLSLLNSVDHSVFSIGKGEERLLLCQSLSVYCHPVETKRDPPSLTYLSRSL